MPELPEVEHLRRTLLPHLVGSDVVAAKIPRTDILDRTAHGRRTPTAETLLLGKRIVGIDRHGKQMALLTERAVLCVQLGMAGNLRLPPSDSRGAPTPVHVELVLPPARGDEFRFGFRDPGRFGGLGA